MNYLLLFIGLKIWISILNVEILNDLKWEISFAGMFTKLLRTADKFLQKLNLRRLKMGTIIEFLDRFGMVKSKEAMAKVIVTIKVSDHLEWFCYF